MRRNLFNMFNARDKTLSVLGENVDMAVTGFAARDRWFLTLLGAIFMINFVDRTIIAVVGEAIRRDLQLSDLQLGMMGGLAFALFYAVLGIPLARLAERFNRVRLIAVVTVLWSIMTALCGAAGGYVQLLLCRMGVGVGEAGFTPALVSMISDRFPVGRRALVYSLIALGAPLGSAFAAVAGSAFAQHFGWRWTMAAVGVPGLVLALLLYTTIPEPERKDAGDKALTPRFTEVLRRLGRSASFLHLTCGSGLVGLVGFGTNLFLIPLLVRRFELPLSQAGLIFAMSFSLATMVGQITGGNIASRLIERDIRWGAWAPAITVGMALPLYLLALYQSDWRVLVGFLFVATALLYAFTPAVMTVTQTLVEPRMRASAAALHAFGQTVAGLGIGSVALGYLSDRLADYHFAGDYAAQCLAVHGASPAPGCLAASATGLQQSMLISALVLIVAVFNYLVAAKHLPSEAKTA
ncbi:MFS transporter [Paraburkholderia sp.]|uniref:spinster family MFS transporter n=1 Tax=Paraburkholderia sp. TaxID=1926495 RepID=UPI00239650D0|nr:MFS transporter [Paraburkholderia sp.]MDE1184712.1 MFS transporter [Paraburkholderia sp.]